MIMIGTRLELDGDFSQVHVGATAECGASTNSDLFLKLPVFPIQIRRG